MVTLDRVIDMQKQGLSETQISAQLQNEGLSPKDISESLNQARIKNAVSPPKPETPGTQQPPAPETYPPQEQEMQSSIMQPPSTPAPETQEIQQPPAPETYPPQTQEIQQPRDNYYPQTPQAYSPQDYYTPQNTLDTETISEIAEQAAIEKLDEFKKKTGDLVSFKTSIQDKVSDIDDRLKRIENSIDKLQQAIIGKIGEFGESNTMLHRDLDNLHGTVAKLMNPLIDNYKELKKLSKDTNKV